MNDLISRQAAITLPVLPKEYREYQTSNLDDAYEQGWNDLQKCIESLPSAQQWIPCSERLPEEDGDYLVCYEGGYREDYGFPKIGIAPFEVDCEGFGIWQEEFDLQTLGSLGSKWVVIPVDAWMSLPDPYEVKSNG